MNITEPDWHMFKKKLLVWHEAYMECPIGKPTETEKLERDIGLLREAVSYNIP